MKISYNWLKWYIPDVPPAEKLADLITYHLAEVETVEKREDGDSILDVKILPNRAHDLLSHMGMGQELASLLNISYTDPTPKYKIPETKPTNLKIELESDKCRRYMGRIVRNVKVGPSPDWVKAHLESIGQRSINNMVDAANLVMFNTGQPTHVFDLNKLKEKIVVRNAKEGETLITLDNKNLKLKETDLVIADAAQVQGLAGVKGGKPTEVDENTTDIVIEVANFEPVTVRKAAQSHGIFTDARKRFENDLSPELAAYGMRELSALIAEMCADAQFEAIVDLYPSKPEVRKVSFKADRVSNMLGYAVSIEEIKDVLKRYHMEFSENGGVFEVTSPALRLDLVIEEDMVEEMGRILGYDKVPPTLPKLNFASKPNEIYEKILWSRHKLLNDGYSEVMTYAFRDKGEVEVLQSASDKKFLRTNLKDGLTESLKLNKLNAPYLGDKDTKIFEIGAVFTKDKEEIHVAYNEKGNIIEKTLAEFAKDMSPHAETANPSTQGVFKMWSLYPFITRDVAVWVPEGVTSEEVKNVIKENIGDMAVKGPELFDEFKKDGKISYAFRTIFQSYDRTLTDVEINEVMKAVTDKLIAKGWTVR